MTGKIRKQREEYIYYECSSCRSNVAFSDPKCPNCNKPFKGVIYANGNDQRKSQQKGT